MASGFADAAGVGLFFEQTPANLDRVYVKTIVKGGSAERDGTIQPGDVLNSVDGQAVRGGDLGGLRKLILGEVGTMVTLSLTRQVLPPAVLTRCTISLATSLLVEHAVSSHNGIVVCPPRRGARGGEAEGREQEGAGSRAVEVSLVRGNKAYLAQLQAKLDMQVRSRSRCLARCKTHSQHSAER